MKEFCFFFLQRIAEASDKDGPNGEQVSPGKGGGGLPYETDGDARRKF